MQKSWNWCLPSCFPLIIHLTVSNVLNIITLFVIIVNSGWNAESVKAGSIKSVPFLMQREMWEGRLDTRVLIATLRR